METYQGWRGQAPRHGSLNAPRGEPFGNRDFSRSLSLSRSSSAIDMRALTAALIEAREGTGEVKNVLLKASFKPRLPGLTKIVSKLSKEGAWRKALEVYEAVELMGLHPDTALTNSAISACDKGGRWQKALDIFESMERLRLPRDAITYSATISSLAKGKQWHAALAIFDHMQQAGIDADVVTCCSLINALERGGQWQLAEKLFLQMCTLQGEDQVDGYAQAPQGPGPGSLLRSQTSPTSVLLMNGLGGAAAPRTENSNGLKTPPPSNGSLDILSAMSPLDIPQGLDQPVAPFKSGTDTSPAGNTNGKSDDLSTAFKRALFFSNIGELPPEATASPFASHTGLTRGNSIGFTTLFPNIPEDTTLNSSSDGTGLQTTYSSSRVMSPGPSPLRPPSPAPSSRLQRSGSLRSRGLGPTHQAETSAHLRRAMSCYPDLDPGEAPNAGGMDHMFTFSHAAKVTPNRVCCNALLAAYARAKPPQWQKAVHLLTAMWGGGPSLTPDSVSYNTVLKACANSFQLTKAMELYREMSSHGIAPNGTTLTTLFGAAADAGAASAMQEIGDWLDVAPLDVIVGCSNAYVSGLVKVGLWKAALARYQDMLSPLSPIHPAAATCNAIMGGYLKRGNWSAVQSVFEEMISSGISPSIVSYNTLLQAQAQGGQWIEALKTLQHVVSSKGEGINPNTTTFNVALSALEVAVASIPASHYPRLASQTLHIYQQMQSGGAGCAPDTMTFTSMIRILQATGHPAQVLAMHEVATSLGHFLGPQAVGDVIEACLGCGNIQKAASLAHTLQVSGVMLEPAQMTGILSACIANGAMWDQAVTLCSSVQGGKTATQPCFNFVLTSAIAGGQFGVAMDIVKIMQALELEPDLGAAGVNVPRTSSLSSSLSPSPSLFAPTHGNQGIPLSRLGSIATEGGDAPRPSLTLADTNAMMAAMQEAGDTAGTLEVLRNMRLAGITPNQQSYETAIATFVAEGQPHIALQLCIEGHRNGAITRFAPDRVTLGGDVAIDVRGANPGVSLITILTWAAHVGSMDAAAIASCDYSRSVKVLVDAGASGSEVQREVMHLLTTGRCAVSCLDGLVGHTVTKDAVNLYQEVIEIQIIQLMRVMG